MPSPPTDAVPQSLRWWLRSLGVVWLALFLLWFYSFDLPNGRLSDGTPVSRGDVWSGLSDVLLENIFPTPTLQAPPSGWRFLPQRFDILGVAAFILAGAWGLGHLVLRAMSLRGRFDAPSRTVFAFALGLSGQSLLTLGCGLMGHLSRGFFAAVLLSFIAAEAVCRFRDRPQKTEPKKLIWFRRRWDHVPILCLLAVTPFVIAMLLGAMLPSTDFDVKEYHLEGPKEYFLLGEVTFLPHNVYTSFPFLTEMLSLLGMVLRDDWYRGALVGKAVLMAFAPLTALGLFATGRRWFSPTVGWLCVLLSLTTPWIYRISIIALAEGGLTFYLFATLLAVMWITDVRNESPENPEGRLRFRDAHRTDDAAKRQALDAGGLCLCGLLAGSAVACKYPGVLSVAIPLGGFLLWWTWSQSASGENNGGGRIRQTLIAGGLFTLGTLITFGPWMAKNIAETGNPVYPLLYSVFGGEDWDDASHRKWQDGHPPAIINLVKNPTSLAANLGTRVVDVVARSDWQSPLLFGAAPFALLWTRRRRMAIGLWAYVGWLFLTWWALTHQLDRFWVPMLPVVALLAGAGLGAIIGEDREDAGSGIRANSEGQASEFLRIPLRRRLSLAATVIVSLLVATAVLFNLAFITSKLCGYNAYLIDLDVARRNTTTPSIALLHERLPPGARVLFVGEAQVFDAEFDYAYNTVFDESLLERWTSAADPNVPSGEQKLRPAEEIRRTLREHGITHVFVNWSEVIRYRQTYGYTDYVSPDRFGQLVRAEVLTPVSALSMYELFEVR